MFSAIFLSFDAMFSGIGIALVPDFQDNKHVNHLTLTIPSLERLKSRLSSTIPARERQLKDPGAPSKSREVMLFN